MNFPNKLEFLKTTAVMYLFKTLLFLSLILQMLVIVNLFYHWITELVLASVGWLLQLLLKAIC